MRKRFGVRNRYSNSCIRYTLFLAGLPVGIFCRHGAFDAPGQLALPYLFKGYPMYPVHDVDAILLLAMSLAAKRRPAELFEILAAAELTQGALPSESKLMESFYRLSAYGLICEQEGGYTLTPDAQQIVSSRSRKAKTPERVYDIKENLADYNLKGEHTPILLTEEQLGAAMLAHQASKKSTARNLLVPKPKPAEDPKRPGQRKPYQPFAARRRKD